MIFYWAWFVMVIRLNNIIVDYFWIMVTTVISFKRGSHKIKKNRGELENEVSMAESTNGGRLTLVPEPVFNICVKRGRNQVNSVASEITVGRAPCHMMSIKITNQNHSIGH